MIKELNEMPGDDNRLKVENEIKSQDFQTLNGFKSVEIKDILVEKITDSQQQTTGEPLIPKSQIVNFKVKHET